MHLHIIYGQKVTFSLYKLLTFCYSMSTGSVGEDGYERYLGRVAGA